MASIRFEDFGGDAAQTEGGHAAADAPQVDPLDSYEQGYKAGWDDAVAHQDNESARIGAELGNSLADLRHGYEEARADVMAGLRPVLSDIVSALLPPMAEAAIGPTLVSELSALVDGDGSAQPEIRVAPERQSEVEALLSRHSDVPARVIPDPTLAAGQIRLSVREEEREIDLSSAARRITTAIEAFLAQSDLLEDSRHA